MERVAVLENGWAREICEMGVVVRRMGDECVVEGLVRPVRVRARKACSAPREGIGGIVKEEGEEGMGGEEGGWRVKCVRIEVLDVRGFTSALELENCRLKTRHVTCVMFDQ